MKKNHLLFTFFAAALCFTGCVSSKTDDTPKTALQLMRGGKVEEAKNLFNVSEDINAIDEDGNTLLHYAAKMKDSDLALFFVIKGADPCLKNFEGKTPLHVAIEEHAFSVAKVLADTGDCIYARNSDGIPAIDLALNDETASDYFYDCFISEKTAQTKYGNGRSLVHHFVESRNLKGIKACIDARLNLSEPDNDGFTPLDVAFADINDYDAVEIAAALIQGGADEVVTDFSYFQEAVSTRNINNRFDDGQTPLHLSAIYGHNAIATWLLENNADTEVQDSSGATPLHEAIRYGNLDIAKMILDAGGNPNSKDNLGKTPIMLIIPKDKVKETYSLLIRYRADLNQKDMYGDTVLHTAAMLKVDTSILQTLISGGAEINARNKEGVTPLAIAVNAKDVQAISLFTSHGADIHTQDTHGKSPLSIVLEPDCPNNVFMATVNSSNVYTQDSEGNTALHSALLSNAALTKIQHIVSLMDDVNIRNKDGNSALYIAALKNRQEVGEILLAKNADIFVTNTANSSPLRLALKYSDTIQKWIITSKTIKSCDGSGNTVLHYASEWGYGESINSLILKGADVNAKNANGETCLFNAAKTNKPEIIQILIDNGASIKVRDNLGSTPLHTAVRWDAEKSASKLIELGININAQNSAGKSPLAEAALAGKLKVSKYLLENGADANSCDTDGVTILMDTIRGQNKDLIKLLLEYGSNPNLQAINGQNAYHEAAYTGNKDIIKLIRNAGGNPLSRDKNGRTPFSIVLKLDYSVIKEVLGNSKNITDTDGNSPIHIVVRNKASKKLLENLINEGYPIDTRNADGYTPLNWAIKNGTYEYAEILLQNGANPFQSIDKKGTNGVTIALEQDDKGLIANIVKYASNLTDIQGNTILHYAAKTSSVETVKSLISYGIETNVKNVAGDTPLTIATRWKRPEIADIIRKASNGGAQ